MIARDAQAGVHPSRDDLHRSRCCVCAVCLLAPSLCPSPAPARAPHRPVCSPCVHRCGGRTRSARSEDSCGERLDKRGRRRNGGERTRESNTRPAFSLSPHAIACIAAVAKQIPGRPAPAPCTCPRVWPSLPLLSAVPSAFSVSRRSTGGSPDSERRWRNTAEQGQVTAATDTAAAAAAVKQTAAAPEPSPHRCCSPQR